MTVNRLDIGQLNKTTITDQGFLKTNAFATRTGVFNYLQKDGSIIRELRHPDEVFKRDSLDTLKDQVITNNHPLDEKVDAHNAKELQVGMTGATVEPNGIFVETTVTVTDNQTVKQVESGKTQLSCGYVCDLDFTPGVFEGLPYDAEQKNIKYNHLAIVDSGRAGPDVRLRLDANTAIMINEENNMNVKNDGRALTALLNRSVKSMESDTVSRSDIISRLATAAGISESTVGEILTGNINDPPLRRLQGFARILNISLNQIIAASERDGNKPRGDSIKIGVNKMAKIMIDSIEYEFSDTATAQKIGEKLNELNRLNNDYDKLQGQYDALKTENKDTVAKKDAEIKKLNDNKQTKEDALKEARARIDLEDFAKEILEDDFKFEGKTDSEIKVAIIQSKESEFSIKDKPDEYVNAYFDAFKKSVENDGSNDNVNADKLKNELGKNKTDKNNLDADVIRDKYIADSKEQYKQPING